MASKSSSGTKTLRDFFHPVVTTPPNKRLKPYSTQPDASCDVNDDCDSEALDGKQKSRIEFNKSRARAKRNLKICSERVSKAKEERGCYVKLDELLVEETWLEMLSGEFQKPYAQNLSKFVEGEICSGGVPIYPPQHLIFNALNSTFFDNVKVVILGQDPYHGPGQAMGLSFSVPEGLKLPSSLLNIFKELQQDLGCSIPPHGNLQKWAVQWNIAYQIDELREGNLFKIWLKEC